MSGLTDEEKAMLAELDEKQIIKTRGRKHPEIEEGEFHRTEILKNLCYKDSANFSIEQDFYGYLFISRTVVGGKRF